MKWDIIASEEARNFGIPYKLQVWSNKHYGDVEIIETKNKRVHFKFDTGFKTMDIQTFCKNFKFKNTLY